MVIFFPQHQILRTPKALKNCSLTVHVSTKLNRSHLIHGKKALILPCLGRSERDIQKSGAQFISVENSMGVVHQSSGHLTPLSQHLLSEPAIIARLAKATLTETKVNWTALVENYDRIRDSIEAIPSLVQSTCSKKHIFPTC